MSLCLVFYSFIFKLNLTTPATPNTQLFPPFSRIQEPKSYLKPFKGNYQSADFLHGFAREIKQKQIERKDERCWKKKTKKPPLLGRRSTPSICKRKSEIYNNWDIRMSSMTLLMYTGTVEIPFLTNWHHTILKVLWFEKNKVTTENSNLQPMLLSSYKNICFHSFLHNHLWLVWSKRLLAACSSTIIIMCAICT